MLWDLATTERREEHQVSGVKRRGVRVLMQSPTRRSAACFEHGSHPTLRVACAQAVKRGAHGRRMMGEVIVNPQP